MAAVASSSRIMLSSSMQSLRSSGRLCAPSVATVLRRPLPSQRRALHQLPLLPHKLVGEGIEGCSPLFSSQALHLIGDDWHAGLHERLNDEVRGTQWENASVPETVIGTAKSPELIQAFNYASLALNNSFFLHGLKPKTLPPGVAKWMQAPPPKPPISFAQALERHFDSLPAFKLAFSSAAYGMSGSGYVWLVRDRHDNLGIVPTFGAGTLLVQNRQQREGARQDWTKASSVEDGAIALPSDNGRRSSNAPPPTTTTSFSPYGFPQSRSFSTTVGRAALSTERYETHGEELFPLLCVSVHERDWLPDYGMWGKEEYLTRFWECVDWQRVHRLYETYRSI